MSSDRAPLGEFDWLEIFPWVRLTRTAAIAWSWKALLLSLVGMTLTTAGWRGIAGAFARYTPEDDAVQDGAVNAVMQQASASANAEGWRTPLADVIVARPPDWSSAVSAAATGVGRALADLPAWYTRGFWQLFAADGWRPFSMAALSSLWTVAVWAFCGGAITRLAASRFAQDRSLGLLRAGRYVAERWRSYFSGPLLPLAGVALFVLLPAVIAGAIARLDVGFTVVGALWPLGLLLALMTSIMLIALLVGWPLMAAAVSADGSDAYDSVSRMFGYVTHRPFHLAFYAAVATLIGAAAWCYVAVLGELAIHLTAWAVSWGSGTARGAQIDAASSWTAAATVTTGGNLVAFWTGLARMVVAAFGHSFLWTAATGVYLLLRRDTDGTPLGEVFPDWPKSLVDELRTSLLAAAHGPLRPKAASHTAP